MSSSYSSYNPGDVINYSSDPTANLTMTTNAYANQQPIGSRTLLFSDDPEYVKSPGILYQDTIDPQLNNGQFRVFAYHVNSLGKALYFSIMLSNTSMQTVTVSITKTSTAGPSTSYTLVGKTAVKQWLHSNLNTTLTISPGQTVFLRKPVPAKKNQLVHFIVDAVTNGPVTLTVAARNDQNASLNNLKVLPAADSTPMRGTFATADYYGLYAADLSGNGQYAPSVTGASEYLVGYSAVDHKTVTNFGNYGVLYHTIFQVTPLVFTSAALVLNSRGGTFATEAYVILNGVPQGNLLDVPTGTVAIGTHTITQGVLLLKNTFSNQTAYTIETAWMPSGGTNLPVVFFIQPYS